MRPPPPISTLFPYTTLFRSAVSEEQAARKRVVGGEIVDKAGADPGVAYVRVRLTAGDLDDIDRSQAALVRPDRKSTRLNSSHVEISYAVFCLKKKNTIPKRH